jgi:hypothetical protein
MAIGLTAMHVAGELFVEAFEVQIEGERVSPDTVFPDWSPLDRFGIVVAEPLGGLGASLLIQLAIAMFYSVRPDRRADTPVYPEIYLFHAGGPHGDFSYFDFWPPRKEVQVAASQPVLMLEAINAHGITRLATPPGDKGAESVLRSGPSTWAEQASAMDRLRSCFVYTSDGRVADGDVRISSRDPRVRENITASVTPLPGVISYREELASSAWPRWPDPSVAADGYRWADVVERRVDEVAQPVRDRVAAALAARGNSDELVEVYQRVTTAESLAYIAGRF